jgi:FkbM family methyltransferase
LAILFVDVGVGTPAIWAGELVASVIALKPAADVFALLLENVLLNGYSVETIQSAAGASSGGVRFTSGQDSLSRLDPAGSGDVTVVKVDDLLGGRVARA